MEALKKQSETTVRIHEILSERWSPRAFEPRPVEPEKLRRLFEAARWAASSYNAQPWYFIVATKDDAETFDKVLASFVEGNRAWAKNAPVVALSVARVNFEHNGQPNRYALYDVGQASANLAVQATAMGLQVHQMGGILPEKARELFAIPPEYEVVAGIALGYPAEPDSLPEELRREAAPRVRKAVESFVFSGKWGEVAPFAK